MVEWKNQDKGFPIKSGDGCYDNEVDITDDEKEYTEENLLRNGLKVPIGLTISGPLNLKMPLPVIIILIRKIFSEM